MCIDVNVFLLFSNPGLSSLDGVVYCIGGSNGSTGSKVCFKLKPGSSKWQRIADLHIGKTIRCGRVVKDFEREAKTSFNF